MYILILFIVFIERNVNSRKNKSLKNVNKKSESIFINYANIAI